MRVRTFALAAALAFAAPVAGEAADMAGYIPAPMGPDCGGLKPESTYVPPQVAYIVACTVAVPTPVAILPVRQGFGHWWNHGSAGEAEVSGFAYAGTREGKLVYFKEWRPDRPPVHLLVPH